MAATFEWDEFNGAGPTQNHNVGNMNWKNVDDTTTAYTASPITAPANSFHKVQAGHFSGVWNQILNGKWSPHTAGALGANLTLVGKVSTTYTQPATSALAGTTDYSSIVAIGSGATVNFSATAGGTMTASISGGGTGYTQYLFTQLQVASGAAAGDTATITGTLQYDEN
jgi:hypothetical protein